MNKLSQAICFATEAFDGKVRKAEDVPAIFHSLEAAAIAQAVCADEEVVCAAVLHDLVEDAGIKLSDIKERFGERVEYLVYSETENKYTSQNPSDTWELRKSETLNRLKESTDIGVRVLWLSDKLSNMRSLYRLKERMGDEMWNMFNQKDPEKHKKYYHTIAKELEVLSDTACYKEFVSLINKLFGE